MRFGILGPIAVWDGDRQLRIGGPREQKLLATLLLHPGKSISLSRLIAAVWNQEPPATARAQIHNSIAALRRNLTQVPIARSGSGFLIGVDDSTLDAATFQRQIGAAGKLAAAGRVEQAIELLGHALDLWRGPALGGIDTGLLGMEARRLDELRLSCLEQRISLELDLGRHAGVVGELHALIEANPLRERLVELHMLALYRCGRRQDALDVYSAMRHRLATESGLDPLAAADALHQAILRGDGSLDVRPATPAAAGPIRPAQLPAEAAWFTGRAAAMSLLDGLRRESGAGLRPHAIAAIVGPAGVGKTALAVHWAQRHLADYPDGQLYIDLHGLVLSPLEALGRFLRALGLADAEIASSLDERSAQYRSLLATRHMVIVLDNAGSSEQVRPLLPGGGAQTTLITSRERLDGLIVHEGVLHIELSPLTRAEAVQLLARAADTGSDPQLAELAELCDRLPLALRIAAARLIVPPGRTVAALVCELSDEHRRLTGLSLPSADAAVRTTFASCFASLSEPARNLLCAMGWHPGPEPSLAACAALGRLPIAAAERLLAELTSRHVVIRAASDRYRMHDLIKIYARERAETDLRHDIISWYLAAADGADQVIRPYRTLPVKVEPGPAELPGFRDETEALAWFDDEAANLMAAITAAEASDPVLCWKLAAVHFAWLERRQRRAEWFEIYTTGIRAASAANDPVAEAVMRQSLAVCLHYMNRPDDAIVLFEQVVAVRRRIGDRRQLAISMMNLGNQCAENGRDEMAMRHLSEALSILETQSDSRSVVGIALNNLGWAHHRGGRMTDAIDCYQRAAAIAREMANPQGVAFAEGNLAQAHAELHQHERALEYWQRATRAARQAGDRRLEADSLAGIGRAHLALDDTARARADLQEALAIYLEIADPRAEEISRLITGRGPATPGEPLR